MPRISVLQVFTFLLLVSACVYVANHVARYLLRVDGGYSEWSGFNECSRTCGGGIRLRRRVCSNPYPRLGGRNCSLLGKPIQVFKCNRNPCPVNGGYGNWLPFGSCSSTCGDGIKQRRRNCDRPLPKYGGKNCKEMELGEDTETAKCNERKCPVHGGYSEWSKFGECSMTCDGGMKIRTRECNNPTPDLDGKNCTELGPSEERLACNIEACPTTLPPTTTPPTTSTKQLPLTKAETKSSEQTTKSTAKQKRSTTVASNSKDGKSGFKKEQNKAPEMNPTTSDVITTETAKSNQRFLRSSDVVPTSSTSEFRPSVADLDARTLEKPRNDTIPS